jgi:streptomycin 6-kinase
VIPAKLAETSVRWEGDAARAWLARLPSLVTEVAERWDLDVARPLEPGGNISWVARVRRRSDGLRAILKVQLPHPESAPEAVGLRAWGGEGAVAIVADVMGVDREALLEWCLVGSVETGAWARSHGDDARADRCEAHARLLAPLLP